MAEPKPLQVEYAAMRSRLSGAQYATVRLLAIERASRYASSGGTLLSSRQVSQVIERDRRYARKVLIRLEELGIFECTLRGAGRRPNAYRFAPLEYWHTLSKSQRDAVELRAQRVADSRETGANGAVAVPPSPPQAFVVRPSRPAQSSGSAGRKDPPSPAVVRTTGSAQTDAVDDDDTYSLVRSSLTRSLQGGSEQHAQPVIDAIEARTPVIGAPKARVVYACSKLDDVQLRAVVTIVEQSTLATATALAELVESATRRVALERSTRAPAPPAFEPDDWPDERVRPDFEHLRAQLRETADVEAGGAR